MCSLYSIARLLSRFDVLLSVFFAHRWLLYFHVATSRWWNLSQLLMNFGLKHVFFFGHGRIAICFYLPQFCMQGAQPELEFTGIGVNVHLPSVALKAYVGGSHGHCWVELRYLLRHLLYFVSTCRWVKARSDWFESSWSKRHMLTRADFRD